MYDVTFRGRKMSLSNIAGKSISVLVLRNDGDVGNFNHVNPSLSVESRPKVKFKKIYFLSSFLKDKFMYVFLLFST
jgi:hypothetical protein